MELKSSIAYLLRNGKGLSESAIVEIFKSVFGTKEKDLIKALREMKRKKEILRDQDLIKSTARIKRRIPRVEKIKYNLPLWHRNWTMVVFNIPETKKSLRDQIRYQLKKHGFAVWQNSVWVSPHSLDEMLKRFLTNHNLEKNVKVFSGSLSSDDEKELVENIWQLQQLEKGYRNFVIDAKRSFKRLKNLSNLENELKEKALDLLAKTTEVKYLNIVRFDPFLPRPLLPRNWIGSRAFRIYQQLEKYLR